MHLRYFVGTHSSDCWDASSQQSEEPKHTLNSHRASGARYSCQRQARQGLRWPGTFPAAGTCLLWEFGAGRAAGWSSQQRRESVPTTASVLGDPAPTQAAHQHKPSQGTQPWRATVVKVRRYWPMGLAAVLFFFVRGNPRRKIVGTQSARSRQAPPPTVSLAHVSSCSKRAPFANIYLYKHTCTRVSLKSSRKYLVPCLLLYSMHPTQLPHNLDVRSAASAKHACVKKPDNHTTNPHPSSSEATANNNGPRNVRPRHSTSLGHHPHLVSGTGTVDDSGDEDYLPSDSPSSSDTQDSPHPRRKQGERSSWCGGGIVFIGTQQ